MQLLSFFPFPVGHPMSAGSSRAASLRLRVACEVSSIGLPLGLARGLALLGFEIEGPQQLRERQISVVTAQR